MASRLADSTSPYLRSHADNPVAWFPWGPEAFAEAERRDVPVLISIGYSTCHWCHVMARESFSDPDTAAEAMRLLIGMAGEGGAAVLVSSHDMALLDRFPMRRLRLEAREIEPGTVESRLIRAEESLA